MKFACLVYLDGSILAGLPPEEASRLNDACLEFDARHLARGEVTLAYPMQPPGKAVTIRQRDGRLSATDGPFAETKEALAGFFLVDTPTLEEAIAIAGRSPLVAAGGTVEVRPFLPREHS
jgi:hypothetical protein